MVNSSLFSFLVSVPPPSLPSLVHTRPRHFVLETRARRDQGLGEMAWKKHIAIYRKNRPTYTKILDVAEDLVVESKVIARDDVDTGIFLDLPVL